MLPGFTTNRACLSGTLSPLRPGILNAASSLCRELEMRVAHENVSGACALPSNRRLAVAHQGALKEDHFESRELIKTNRLLIAQVAPLGI